MRRYHVTTFGCQMNAHDSERIKGMLEELGLGETTVQEEADVVVFNTCTIREKPDTRFAAHLAQAIARKRRRPDTVIAVGGCYAEAQRERLFALYPEVDVAFGPGSIAHLGEWIGAGGIGVARGRFGLDARDFAATLPAPRERGRPRGHAARPERELVGPRPAARRAHGFRRAAPRVRRRRRNRAHPLHESASQRLP